MNKTKLQVKEIFDVIVNCNQSDINIVKRNHVLAGKSLSECIDRTVLDLMSNNIDVYSVTKNDSFIGYFGEDTFKDEKWLTGFFIMPGYRTKDDKAEFWNMITEHFNNNFKTAVLNKNKPASKFLKQNGCVMINADVCNDGIAEIYSFVKEGA